MSGQGLRIVVLDGYTTNPGDLTWEPLERLASEFVLHDRTLPDLTIERAAGFDVVITNKTPLGRDVVSRLDDCRYIGLLSTGYNIVDIEAARERSIPVTNVPEYSTETVAQFTVALLMELTLQIGAHSRSVTEREEWASCTDFCYWKTPLVEVAGLTLGLVGFGRIGRRVGAIAHAMGMRVMAAGSGRSPLKADFPFQEVTVAELFRSADVVSLHCPFTNENGGFVNRELIGTMKGSAYLINTARGQLVNEADLAEALNAERIAGAACDVLSKEPPPADNPLLKTKNIILTPHIAWAARPARVRLMETVADNIGAWRDGRAVNVVNGVG